MLALLLTNTVSLGKLLNLSDSRTAYWLNKGREVTNEFLMQTAVGKHLSLIGWTEELTSTWWQSSCWVMFQV